MVKNIIIVGVLLMATFIWAFSPKGKVAYEPNPARWLKVTKAYSDFATAALTNTINLTSIPAKGVVHGVLMQHTSSFGGGSIATYTISVGITGQNQYFIGNSNVFTAPSPTLWYMLPAPIVAAPFSSSSATNITATAISTVANLSAATTGSVDIYLLITQLP